MNDTLKYFMRKPVCLVKAFPAPGGITNDNGEPINIRVRQLLYSEILEIEKKCTKETLVADNKGKTVFYNGKTLRERRTDRDLMQRLTIVKALEYPNLTDPALLDFFGVTTPEELPLLIWPQPAVYAEILQIVGEMQEAKLI